MTLLHDLKFRLKSILRYKNEITPSQAYDLWAANYDAQTNNPLIHLDEKVFGLLISHIDMEGKVIVDIGCGTGRHWKKLFAKKPQSMIGCDVSEQMLKVLYKKYPQAETYVTDGISLKGIEDETVDLITCNLTIGYISELSAAFDEWCRVLKPESEILITDFHPVALSNGGKRVFTHNGKVLSIKNYLHTLDEIQVIADKNNYMTAALVEMKVDETIRNIYAEHGNLSAYYNTYGTPILYGLHLKRSN